MSSQDERNGGGQKSCGSFTSRPKHSQSDDSTMALLNWSAEVVLGRSYMLSNLCCQSQVAESNCEEGTNFSR